MNNTSMETEEVCECCPHHPALVWENRTTEVDYYQPEIDRYNEYSVKYKALFCPCCEEVYDEDFEDDEDDYEPDED